MKRFIFYVRCRKEFALPLRLPLESRIVVEAETYEKAWAELFPAILESFEIRGINCSQIDMIHLRAVQDIQ